MEEEYLSCRGKEIHNFLIITLIKFFAIVIMFLVAPADYGLKVFGRRGFSYTDERLYLIKDEETGKYVEITQPVSVFSFSGALSQKDAYQSCHSDEVERVLRKSIRRKN